ncbi:putative Serine/threonine protein kinase [Frankia canadensis]|uniref:Putative Serine/threonine protein kinase n=1 Tax=Frankia canadensis TaxID=1836972 RepID=A0A2I2L1Y9_9ACTN|nr:putative Serine/threonine protein kinase [Frankia canadensis]SOU59224.1 putative Serine/threonine protein kinase [Frankia canadensis]
MLDKCGEQSCADPAAPVVGGDGHPAQPPPGLSPGRFLPDHRAGTHDLTGDQPRDHMRRVDIPVPRRLHVPDGQTRPQHPLPQSERLHDRYTLKSNTRYPLRPHGTIVAHGPARSGCRSGREPSDFAWDPGTGGRHSARMAVGRSPPLGSDGGVRRARSDDRRGLSVTAGPQLSAVRWRAGAVRHRHVDDVHGAGLAGPVAEPRLGVGAGAGHGVAVHAGDAADALRRPARRPVRQAPSAHRREPGRGRAVDGAGAAGVHRGGAAVAGVPVRAGDRAGQRGRDADADGVHQRTRRPRAAAERLRPVRRLLQHRPSARSRRRRAAHRRIRYRPGDDHQRWQLSGHGRRAAAHAPGRDPSAPAGGGGAGAQGRRRPALCARPGGPRRRVRPGGHRRAVRDELPADCSAAGPHRVPRGRHVVRPADDRPRRGLPARRVRDDRPAHPPVRLAGDRLGGRVRAGRGGGRVCAELSGGDRPARGDRLRHALFHAGGQPPHPARQRPGVPGPGDGALRADPAGDDAARRRARRRAHRRCRRPRRSVRRRPALGARRPRRRRRAPFLGLGARGPRRHHRGAGVRDIGDGACDIDWAAGGGEGFGARVKNSTRNPGAGGQSPRITIW